MYLRSKGSEIRKRRKEAGFSQIDLSKEAGFGDGNVAIYRMENGIGRTHPLRAKAVADVLGCRVEDLFEEPEKSAS